MGKIVAALKWLWRLVDGWKSWIWAVVIALQHAFPAWPVWGAVDVLANALHWSAVVPAVDPDALVKWATFTIAIGHRLIKAWRLWRAGVPVVEIHSAPF